MTTLPRTPTQGVTHCVGGPLAGERLAGCVIPDGYRWKGAFGSSDEAGWICVPQAYCRICARPIGDVHGPHCGPIMFAKIERPHIVDEGDCDVPDVELWATPLPRRGAA